MRRSPGMEQPIPHPEPERRRTRRGGALSLPADAVYGAVRWIVGHVRGVYAEAGLFLGLALTTALASVALFAFLAEWVAGGATQAFDEAALAWTRARRGGALDLAAAIGAGLGSGTATWLVLGGGSLLLWVTRHRLSVLLLWISLVGGRTLSAALKELFDRPRPDATGWSLEIFGSPIGFPESPSFPSGHAVTSVVIYGTVAFLVVRLEPTVRQRRLTLGAAALLILWIGLSRVYLGVHYPSDVLAGFLAGFVWVTLSVWTIEVLRYAATRHREIRGLEAGLDQGLDPIRQAVGGTG